MQRIKKEKQLAKEYLEEEEAKRILYLQIEEQDENKHLSATRITFLVLRRKALKEVQMRRVNLLISAANNSMEHSHSQCAVLQRVFRQYATRRWLGRWGLRFDSSMEGSEGSRAERKRRQQDPEGAKLTRGDMDIRLAYEEQQRRLMMRLDLVYSMQRQYIEVCAVLVTNISHWEGRMARLLPAEQSLLRFMVARKGEHMALSKQKGGATADELHRLMLPVIATEQRIVGLREISSLITLLLRTTYRRKASMNGI